MSKDCFCSELWASVACRGRLGVDFNLIIITSFGSSHHRHRRRRRRLSVTRLGYFLKRFGNKFSDKSSTNIWQLVLGILPGGPCSCITSILYDYLYHNHSFHHTLSLQLWNILCYQIKAVRTKYTHPKLERLVYC